MRFIMGGTIIFCLIFSRPIFAQSWDSKIVDSAVDGVVAVAYQVVSDTFTPMTHYESKQWTATVVGAYMDVEQLYDNPELKGDGLNGYSGGIGGGYAFTSNIMLYAIYAGMAFDGNITGKGYDGLSSIGYTMSAEYSLHSMYAGAGFDLLGGNPRWSVPLYAGFGVQKYDVRIDFPFRYSSIFPPISYQHDAHVSGSGFLYGWTVAAACSAKLWKMQITPYVLYYRTINKPDIEAQVHQTAPLVNNFAYDVASNTVSVLTPGLQISGIVSPGLSINISIGGFVASKLGLFDNDFGHGLKVNTIALGITYRGVSQ